MKKLGQIFLFLLINFFWGLSAQAFCPVCTVAVGAGLGFSRWLGIDDTVSGVWIGGLVVSLSVWTISWLKKKKYIFRGYKIVTFLAYYALILGPFYWMGIIGHPFNRFWGVDKILLGIIIGSLIFTLTGAWYNYLKKKNNNHAYFPFQKVVMPVAALLILSFIFYFLTK